MQDKTIIVTGANAGLGFQLCRKLARNGARIVMGCRSPERAAKAHQELMTEFPGADISVLALDVSKLETVHTFADQFKEQFGKLDVLVNNAGIVGVPFSRNEAGHELQLATNYLGAFALTGLLLPMVDDKPGSRIVNVGSLAHRFGKLNLEDFNWEKDEYNQWGAYARSKIAMLTFTMDLDRRLKQNGSHIIALGAHPGFAATEILNKGGASSIGNSKNPISNWFHTKMESIVPTAEQASEPILKAICSESAKGGDYYGPGGLLETGIAGSIGNAKVNPKAFDLKCAKALWTLSEEMTGVSFLPDVETQQASNA